MNSSLLGLQCMDSQNSDNLAKISKPSGEPFRIRDPLIEPDKLKYAFAETTVHPVNQRNRIDQRLRTIIHRRNRSRNNSAMLSDRYEPRCLAARRLPPLKNQDGTSIKDLWGVSPKDTTTDLVEGAVCPTDYLKRLGEKFLANSVDVELNSSNDSPRTDDPKHSAQRKKTAKLCPVLSAKKEAHLLSNSAIVTRSKTKTKQSNLSNVAEGVPKRRVSPFNIKNVYGDLGSPLTATLVKDDTVSVKAAESIGNGVEKATLDSTRQAAFRSKIVEEWEDTSNRDRYLSAMEEMLKKHKALSTRTTRGATLLGSNSSAAVPSRRIQTLSTVPEDPMMRFTGRHLYHSMGFKMPEKSDSLVVEPDDQQIRQVSFMQECEQRLMESDTLKGSQLAPTPLRTEIATSPQTGMMEINTIPIRTNSKADSEQDSWDQSSLEPISSDSESATELESEFDRSVNHHPSIDSSRVYFYFNPVVQIYPNQTPWRSRSNIPTKRFSRSDFDVGETNTKPEEETDIFPGVDPTDESQHSRRPQSVDHILLRHFSVDKTFEMRQVIRSLRHRRTCSSSSLSDLQTFSTISEMTDLDEYLDKRRCFRSASESALVGLGSVTFRGRVPGSLADNTATARLGVEQTERSIITHGGLYRPRGSLSIYDAPAAGLPLPSIASKPVTIINTVPDTKSRVCQRLEKSKFASKSKTPDRCLDVYVASTDPNPMTWFDILDERLANCTQRITVREKLIAQFRLKGLQKRFVAIPNGLYGLQSELEKGWDIRPKPELLMSCVVKHHVLKMPMNTPYPSLVEKIYTNSIVRHPVLYKLIMRRREILPQELQQFLNRIMELTETSDRMMTSITACTSKLNALTTAAREMDASGFMTGGPKLKQNHSDFRASNRTRSQRSSLNSRTGLPMASDTDFFVSETIDSSLKPSTSKKDAGLCPLYGKETDFDKEFYTVLRNPCANILEEVALHIPEFAWHVRPLFEHRWATLEDDLFEKMLEHGVIPTDDANGEQTTVSADTKPTITGGLISSTAQLPDELKQSMNSDPRGMLLHWPETYDFCERLFHQVLIGFTQGDPSKIGNEMLMDLLICIHMTNYSRKLSDLLVKELDQWIPPLLGQLESNYPSNREDSCCVLAYLVCSYRLITRLHVVSKNLLVANICFAVLSAIGHYPENYAFYHGLLGYMLHALPCLSTLDCLLLWLPSVQNNEANLVARDWGLLVYYVLRHWPRNPFYLDTMYQKKLLKPLEVSYLKKYAKRGARLALSYLVRTCNVRSALLICWPESEEDVVLD